MPFKAIDGVARVRVRFALSSPQAEDKVIGSGGRGGAGRGGRAVPSPSGGGGGVGQVEKGPPGAASAPFAPAAQVVVAPSSHGLRASTASPVPVPTSRPAVCSGGANNRGGAGVSKGNGKCVLLVF